ncbi:diacylglycerol acyltransferase type 2 [Raphidocelis subcapitata]|uniref:Acyltransferase n=1 Tax=Raphidocelis subcapitata TaxID=307507 RepID=A0A2V0PJM9_9CHLO|nr:diacylglycerol acyltransferase type 2 [Raphidocelis subcapitata]|eukprot:GBF98193.1 diacylglycerol acyltransferase type 2 [Raphidocelis subcapitata]
MTRLAPAPAGAAPEAACAAGPAGDAAAAAGRRVSDASTASSASEDAAAPRVVAVIKPSPIGAGAAAGGGAGAAAKGGAPDACREDSKAARDQSEAARAASEASSDASDSEGSGGEGREEVVLSGKILDAPCGVRVWCDGLGPSSRQPWWEETLALVSLAIFTCWIHIMLAITIWGFFNKWAALVAAAIWSTVFLPARPLLWTRFLGNPVFMAWRRYFRFSMAYDQKMDLTKHYIYAEVPHSVFPLSQLIATSLGADAWQGHKVYSIAADSVFSIPLWRHVFTWVGARPATARQFKRLLKKGSVGLIPGGIAEMFLSRAPEADVVKLADRKGFVRVAVETGTPLVPIYHFGAWDLCRWVAPRSWQALSRRWRVSMGFVLGRYGLPLPHRVPLFMAVGAPIPVPKIAPSEPGFADAVDAAHAALLASTRDLYNRYRAHYPGYENRELVIV